MELVFEPAYWQSLVRGLTRPSMRIVPYVPQFRQPPARKIEVASAWNGIENILADLIRRFKIDTDQCLEFGVEHGYSTAALSSFFNSVTGVDTFQGDRHTLNREDIYGDTLARLSGFTNITLVRSDYRDFIQGEHGTYGLIHVDIIHTFLDTYACGLWSARHSQCTIFHDTESFPQVKQAVADIARATGKKFYNFKESFGLGIIV